MSNNKIIIIIEILITSDDRFSGFADTGLVLKAQCQLVHQNVTLEGHKFTISDQRSLRYFPQDHQKKSISTNE